MKKIFSLLLLPVFSLLILFGCGNDKKIEDIQSAYSDMVNSYTISGESDFFSDETSPNSIVISYPITVEQVISNSNPSNDVQKRFRALYYQQKILDNIFAYYNNHQEDFYRIAPSKDIDEDEINDLYNNLNDIRDVLSEFEKHYDTFIDAISNGVSDIMEYNLTSYAFYLNRVIDESFDFIYKFHNMYANHCVDNYQSITADNLSIYVDKAYIDISYVVYLENIKSFNYSVGSHGVCDLSSVVGSSNSYNILSLLDNRKSLSAFVQENVGNDSEQGESANESADLFVHAKNVIEQRLSTFITTYNAVNMYNINQYRFNLNGGVDYEAYLTSLSASDRSIVNSIDNFVKDCFNNYVDKLNKIVE